MMISVRRDIKVLEQHRQSQKTTEPSHEQDHILWPDHFSVEIQHVLQCDV